MKCLKTLFMLVTMMVAGDALFASQQLVAYDVGITTHTPQQHQRPASSYDLNDPVDLAHWLSDIEFDCEEYFTCSFRGIASVARSMSGALKIAGLSLFDTTQAIFHPLLAYPGAVFSCLKAVFLSIFALE